MRALLARTAILLIAAAIGNGCGGDGSGSNGPDPVLPGSQLATVEVKPEAVSLFNLPPANTATLIVFARDNNGRSLTGVGPYSFSSENAAVATVDESGAVTAAGLGTALITVSATHEGVTKTGNSRITVVAAPTQATVQTPGFTYQPSTVDVSAGGSVTWVIGGVHHDVVFTEPGSPDNIPELVSASESRTFPTSGVYPYRCTFHANMTGVVRVH